MRKSFLTFLATILFCAPSFATDYPIGDNNNSQTSTLPIVTSSSTYTSITQQLYYASELTSAGASAGNISALKFFFGNKDITVREVTRNLEIYLSLVSSDFTEFVIDEGGSHRYKFVAPGTKVYDGNYTIPATEYNGDKIERTISITNFAWDGTSNIVLTVIDKTNKKFYSTVGEDYSDVNLKSYGLAPSTEAARFVHQRWLVENSSEFNTYKGSLSGKFGYALKTSDAAERTAHNYVNRIKFSITTPIPAPTNLAASSITTSSATLSWDAVDGASSYNVRWGKTSGNLDNSDNVATNSIDISGLEDGETYYFDVQTVKAAGSSAYASEANFTTTAVTHIHDGITFSKWSSTSSLPSEAGNYYLSGDVVLENNYTVPGNINLCLNGHDIYTYAYYITVPDNKTLALYDNVGGGRIYGYYTVELEYSNNGLITITADGTLILNGVSVENLANDFNDGEAAYGIYNIGTLKISGAPVISGYDADINLYTGRVITIESGKPLTNTTPYRIYTSSLGDITSGWANMNGANPSDYLTSAPPARGVCLNSATGEARYVRNLRINESNDNDNISDAQYASQLINASMTRSLTSSQYNTFCLPFALSDAQLQEYFGAGYDLEEFVSSELDGDLLSLTFNKVTSLTAGKPYLLQPAVDVADPTFEAVTLGATSPVNQTSDTYISFLGTYAPTELEGGNKNLLFLGADNELFYPASTANLKGFRAYFEVKGAAQNAAKRARIVQQPGTATDIENQMVNGKCENGKYIKDGQLFIIRDGKTYNILGLECK